jgi:putative two-component system response regulator
MSETSMPTLLIVDDQPENLAVLAALLQPHYRVRAARSGEQALRAAVTPPRPDLALLDVMMPDMDGYAVLARLRENPATAGLPVLFITALAAERDEERGFALGAVDYITKPIKPAVVLARVRTQLDLKRARDLLADQNARLETEVARRTEALDQALAKLEAAHDDLKHTYFDTLVALGDLASLRAGELADHARRVADLGRQVASRLGMGPADVQEVFIAGLLHDVGKIGFPDAMLRKPVSTLNREELDLYRRHPAAGSQILARIASLSGVADVILSHHEHYDGTGFPQGLSGLDIPLGARILCAVSDHESLRAGTLTSRPLSAKQACQVLLQERGTRYDPAVVDALEPILVAESQFEIDELRVAAKNLVEGMQLSRDVLHPNGFVLLSRGGEVTRRLIGQLLLVQQQTGATLEIFVQRQTPAMRPVSAPQGG